MRKCCSKHSHTNKASQVKGSTKGPKYLWFQVGFKTTKCPLDSLPQLVACRFHLQLFLALSVFFPFGKFEVFNTVGSGVVGVLVLCSCSQNEPQRKFQGTFRIHQFLWYVNEFKRIPLFSIFSAILFH